MVNIIVGSSSECGKREFEKGDIGTSRSRIIKQNGEQLEPGLELLSEERIKEGMSKISDIIDTQENTYVTMHAMSMRGMSVQYPETIIRELKTHNHKVHALLISFHDAASEENPEGSHAYYPVRNIKHDMEQSLLTSSADRKKVVDLEIFDSPSSKVLGLTFLGVVGQFIEFIEGNKDHSITKLVQQKLKNFLGKDYDILLDFLSKYPLSGVLKEGQQSMKKLGEEGTLQSILNQLASDINFAKLSYISGVISDLYLELSMLYLKNNKDSILDTQGERILLSWERIKDTYNNEEHSSYLDAESKDSLVSRLEIRDLSRNKRTSGVFVIDSISEDGNTLELQFNPTKENFDIIGNNEKGGHFGVIPLFMVEGLIYDLGLLQEEKFEIMRESKPGKWIYSYNKIVICREENIIKVYNRDNPSEVFVHGEVGTSSIESQTVEKGYPILTKEYNKFLESGVAHGKKWFDIFSDVTLPETPFGFSMDVRATIMESIGVKLARNYFVNINEANKNILFTTFPKLKSFDKLKGAFVKVRNLHIDREFRTKIKGKDFDIQVIDAKGGYPLLTVTIGVIVGNELLLKQSYTFM